VSPQEGIGILMRDLQKYNIMMGEFAKIFLQPKGEKLFTCGAGEDVCIDAYGRAQPCMGLRTPELTLDVLSTNLPGSSQLIGDKGLAYAIEQFTHLGDIVATNPEYLRRCAQCVLMGLCEQCPAKSWAETGTLDTPIEYLCEVAHIHARKSGWLGENVFGWEVANLDNLTG
jgi:radical SAM protein with 4Fe4S-binding SPASM domain